MTILDYCMLFEYIQNDDLCIDDGSDPANTTSAREYAQDGYTNDV